VLTGVARDLRDVLEEALVDLREGVHVRLGGEREAVHLLDDAGEGGALALVVLDLGEDAAEALGQRVPLEARLFLGEAAEVREELAVDEGEHVVGLALRPFGPADLALEDARVGVGGAAVALEGGREGGLLLAGVLGLLEGLEEEEPRELLDVVAGLDALGAHPVGGALDGLLDLGAAVVYGVGEEVGHAGSWLSLSGAGGALGDAGE